MRRLFPNSLSGQFILLLVTALTVSQILNVFLLLGERQFIARSAQFDRVIAELVEQAQELPDLENARLPQTLIAEGTGRGTIFISNVDHAASLRARDTHPKYALQLRQELEAVGLTPVSTRAGRLHASDHLPPPRHPTGRPPNRPNSAEFPRQGRPERGPHPPAHPGPRGPPGPPGPGFDEIILSAEIQTGIWLNARAPYNATEAVTLRAVLTTGLVLLGAIFAAIFLGRHIGRPIRDLGMAAKKLGRGEPFDPLSIRGPKDIAATSIAFNTMQERLTRLIDDQRLTLRALGHDLRTPLTALRIRADSVPAEYERDKIISSIDRLTAMTEEILSWSKDASAMEEVAAIDLSALLDSIAQDYADQAKQVYFSAPDRTFILKCRRLGLYRAITNIVDNALKYAGTAEIQLHDAADHYCITIIDDGPGIPDAELEAVLTPFTRLETSRNRDTGGIGLGLSIARSIMLAHGGTLELTNHAQRGLCVKLCLPV